MTLHGVQIDDDRSPVREDDIACLHIPVTDAAPRQLFQQADDGLARVAGFHLLLLTQMQRRVTGHIFSNKPRPAAQRPQPFLQQRHRPCRWNALEYQPLRIFPGDRSTGSSARAVKRMPDPLSVISLHNQRPAINPRRPHGAGITRF